jgi:hypothetical protein
MPIEVHELLGRWESFYVILGSSGAALTGLQFVAVTLIAELRRRRHTSSGDTANAIGAFGTPTIVHFCAVLLISAILSTPWRSLGSVRIALLLVGVGGAGYTGLAAVRARRQTGYQPVLEDWIWHAVVPAVAYGTLVAGAALMLGRPENALFLAAATTVLLVFAGIHNAWDTVTYVTVAPVDAAPTPAGEPPPPAPEPAEPGA